MADDKKQATRRVSRASHARSREHSMNAGRHGSVDSVEAESRLRSVFRAAPVGIGLVCNRVLVEVNDRLCEMVGYRPDELLGRNSLMLYPGREEWEFVGREKYRQIAERGTGVVETRWRRKDGQVIDVLLSSTPLDPADLEKGVTFTALDITARKRAEEELRNIFTLSLDMICIADLRTGTFTKVNPAFERVLGYSEQELLSRPFVEFVHPDDMARTAAVLQNELSRGEHVYRFENRYRCKDGSYRWLTWTSRPQVEQGLTYAVAHDITDRKQAEEALQHERDMAQRYLDTVEAVLLVLDAEGRIALINRKGRRLLGYGETELIGRPWFSTCLPQPEGMETVYPYFLQLIAGEIEGAAYFENPVLRRDGSLRQIAWHNALLRDEQGQINGILSAGEDITERRLAEESLKRQSSRLQESERRLRTLMGNLPGLVYRCANEPDWPFEFVSEGSLTLTGYRPEEITTGGTVLYGNLIHPEDRQRVWDTVQKAVRGGTSFDIEYRIFTKDGTEKWVFERGRAVPAGDGAPRLEGFITDVTQAKLATEALKEKEYLLSESQRMGRIGSWSVDLASDVLTWTRETYRLYGVSPETFVPSSETFYDLVHPDDRERMRESIRAMLAGEHPNATEFRVVLPDGSIRVLSGRGELIIDDAGRPVRVVGTVQDITESKRAEETLRALNEHLEQLVARRTEDLTRTVTRLQQLTWELSKTEDRERRRIADILHDDVQQTLAAARFHLSLLSAEPRSPEESRELIQQIKQMLKEAIEKARSLSHELSPALYQVDLGEILNSLARHMRDKHGLAVRVEVFGRVELSGEPVKALLYKVAQELLFNVVKHAGTKEAVIRVRRLGPYVTMVVIDHGSGFQPQELDRATGFGLLGIRERIQLLGGRMRIKSSPGRGCRLLIAVPGDA